MAAEEKKEPSAGTEELEFHEHARDQAIQHIRTYGQQLVRETVHGGPRLRGQADCRQEGMGED